MFRFTRIVLYILYCIIVDVLLNYKSDSYIESAE